MINKKQKPDYTALKWKVYFRLVLLGFFALITVLFVMSLSRNNVSELIVSAMQKLFNMSRETALFNYRRFIRVNYDYWVFGSIVFFFIVLSRFLLSQFTKYFNEISDGLNFLVEDKDGEIKLSSEMASMERKLNAIKRTLEKREQEAKEAEQRKNDVVMYLAHDIRTPLTSIIGYLSLLDETPEMPVEQKAKYVNITLEKANRLERLINEFFEITRYSLQTIELTKENIDLYYMLTQITDEFYPLLSVKGKRAVLYAPEDLTVYGDPDKLARVFNNIIKNAAAYSPDGSVIEVAAEVSGGAVSVSFKNEGSVPKEKLAAIFDKFFRLDSARSSDSGGAGLGLAIAKEIIVSHGGEIYADSGGGHTVFTVRLPAVSDGVM